jgi:MFS family permease
MRRASWSCGPANTPQRRTTAGNSAFFSGAVWLCFAFFFVSTSAFGILQNYSPAILGHVYGVSLAMATGSLTAYLLGSATGIVTGGFLATRSEHSERVIAAALGLAAATAIVLASGGASVWMLLPLMVIMGFGVGVAGPSRDLLVRRAATSRFGRAAFGRVYGFVYSGLDTGLALSPLLFGPLLDAGHFRESRLPSRPALLDSKSALVLGAGGVARAVHPREKHA